MRTHALLLTTALMSLSMPAWAQEASSSAPEGPGSEIVVTAQKRVQRLIDVPVAVTAVDAKVLTSQNLVSITDFYNRIPGLQFGGQPGQNRTSDLSLRGITTGGGTNPTLAILVNDVQFGASTYLSQPPIPDFDPATLERVEVLRGPQGTLYGASSLGGLIKYVLREPNLKEFSGRLEAGTNVTKGGNAGYSARGSVNVPIVRDMIALNVSGYYRQDPRYIDNIIASPTLRNVNKVETWGGLASLLVKPTDTLTINLSAFRQEQKTSDDTTIEIKSETDFSQINGAPLDTINVSPGTGERKIQLYSGRAALDLNWGTLTSITAYGKSSALSLEDLTTIFGPPLLGLVYTTAPAGSGVTIANGSTSNKFSQELRLSGTGPVVDWIGGLFYTREKAILSQTLFVVGPDGDQLAVPYVGAGPSTYTEKAAFADVTWHATDALDVQVGGRYSRNRQVSTSTTTADAPAQIIFGPDSTSTTRSKESAFTWLVTPSYKFGRDLMGYIRVASGYRPGGPNTSLPTIPRTFDSDSVINYEIGFKGKVLPDVTLSVAAFRIDWKDIQLQNADSVSQFTFFTNGGRARSQGVELSGVFTPWKGMSIAADMTYTDATLRSVIPALAGSTPLLGDKGDRIPFTAKFTSNLSVDQSFDLNARTRATFGGTFTYVGDRLSAFRNAGAPLPRFTLPEYTTVDLRGGVDYDDIWHVSVYVRNLLNERGVVVATNRSGTSAPRATFVRPRTFGLTLSRDF